MVNKVPLIKASRANRPRNAFDLSQRHLFTAHAGMLLPVMSLDLLPHDHVEINATDFMRTLPMNNAAFVSMRSVYEFFFVPYHQLWSPFDQMITGMSDFHSSQVQSTYKDSTLRVPYFALDNFKTSLLSPPLSTKYDFLGWPYANGAVRLLDLLGYCRPFNSVMENHPNLLVGHFDLSYSANLLRACAYQKIYFDYYRNSHYEVFDASSFNLDGLNGSVEDETVIGKFFELRYRNAGLDYFTSVRPDQFLTLPSVPGVYEMGVDVSSSSFKGVVLTEKKGTSNMFQVSTQSLRSAFAVDKLMRVSMQAGKTFYEQMAAHYGVDIPDSRDGRVDYLGGFDSDIQVSDVTQTSGTTVTGSDAVLGGYLGRVAGKATASGSGRIVFDAKEHGVLMCIYSLVPDAYYDSTKVDPMVTKLSRFDFFTPEFENLGLQPLSDYHISCFTDGNNQVIGYQPRYSEYKTALDVNHGQFCRGDSLSYWCCGRFRESSSFPYIDQNSFKIDPGWLDSIFPVKYNGKESTDCIFGGCNFNVTKVSDMSVDGMPRV